MRKPEIRKDYFKEELMGRQKAGQVKAVMKSLTDIHAIDYKPNKMLTSGKSRDDKERKKLI